MLHGVPCWAALTADNLKGWTPPAGVKRVIVFGDNDHSLTGQAASYELGRRLIAAKYEVEVRLPAMLGEDWNDHHRPLLVHRRVG
jgi:putative DNA primase/helicase